MTRSSLVREFLAWRDDVDGDHLLDVFDLALGFYHGRYPHRGHSLAVEFAAKTRRFSEEDRP